jgi:hypothetical protein
MGYDPRLDAVHVEGYFAGPEFLLVLRDINGVVVTGESRETAEGDRAVLNSA